MSRVEVPVNKKVLLWAREAMGFDLDEASHKLGVKTEKINAWESGESNPTLRQLEKISDLYCQPLLSFFQDKTPEEPQWPVDYRTFPSNEKKPLSSQTRAAIWDAQWRQSVASELRQEMGSESGIKLSELAILSNPEKTAEAVREKIGPNITTQTQWASKPETLLKQWRKVIESIGVLVFRFNFPKEDARAFSLTDKIAPVIAVSGKDYRNAEIFSLFHELAHLIFGESSACNDINFHKSAKTDTEKVEARCNHFAGAYLVPSKELLSHEVVRNNRSNEWDDSQLSPLAHYFGVSREVILRRLLILDRVNVEFYREWRRKVKESWQEIDQPRANYPVKYGYARKRINQQGESYVTTVLTAYSNKIINLLDASEYLDVKTKDIGAIEYVLKTGSE